MKSARRHELQRNELAAWLARFYKRIEPYTNAALGVVILVLVCYVAYTWWSRQSGSKSAQAWDAVFVALSSGNPADMEGVAERFPTTPAGDWANVAAGDMRLAVGCDELFSNKATATQELQKARDAYMTVLDTSTNPVLRERATFGLARAYEALGGTRQSQGELGLAVEQYEKVVQQWPNGTYATNARRRAEDLKRQETKEFYDEFAAHDFSPAASAEATKGGSKLPFETTPLPEGTTPPDFSEILNKLDSGAAKKDTQAAKPAAETSPQPAASNKAAKKPAPSDKAAKKPASPPAESGPDAKTSGPATSAGKATRP